ncbi:efflux RND transporter periplasmic adaptor subunit [Flammeovirga sp. MY04]|uniref:efflux RND transporter periplasmic adaptor subunit n=1 Tax=Flammeovirga sp. MY04 TaxID=1191459 RepID=UPI0008064227|nr:efflux RND transporter periplasmic adaptor subunit [Flammeovirga sp. MY04]ANQ52673.1 efflux RND transporter periplasmic adaptor subunit [Flammeovirga sp. MY04]
MKSKLLFSPIILLSILFSCTQEATQKKAPKEYAVKVEKVASKTKPIVLELLGELKAEGNHQLSFLVDGKLTRLYVKEGQNIKKGQKIAQLDTEDYQEALKVSKAKLDEANDQLSRLTKMYKAGSLAEADYQKIVSLQQQAEAGYNIYKNKLKYTTLYSSISGKVGKIWARPGGGISKGEPIVSLLDNTSLYASVGVPENKINLIKLSGKVDVKIADKEYTGEINKVYPSASKLTRSFTVDILLPEVNEQLREGMMCTVELTETVQRDQIEIPMSLVVRDIDGLDYVFLARNKTAFKKRIITGKISGNHVEITKGLFEGDLLVTNPPLKLMDGDALNY